MILDLTTDAPAPVVRACETQVRDLMTDLARQCEQRIGILTQKAAEEAMRILNADGNLDTAQLILDAQMPPKKV